MEVEELASGLWRWTARHPDWGPELSWEPDVSCFYAETDDTTLVIDPLVPADDEARFWAALDRDVERRGARLEVLLTQAAHARSAGVVARRYDGRVWGHRAAAGKVGSAPFLAIDEASELPGGATVLPLDQEPGGSGTPLFLPSYRAIAVGDVFITVGGELRVWWGPKRADDEWYATRLLPSLRRWLELPAERLLIAHGAQVEGGVEQIAAAIRREPHPGE